jgi:hypothetical protein
MKRKIGHFINNYFYDVDFEMQGGSKKQTEEKIWSLKFEYFFNAFETYSYKREIDSEVIKRLSMGDMQGIDSVYLVFNNKFFAIPEAGDDDYREFVSEVDAKLKEDRLEATFYFNQVKTSNPKVGEFGLFCDTVYDIFDTSNKSLNTNKKIKVLRETLSKIAKRTDNISVYLKLFIACNDVKQSQKLFENWEQTIIKKKKEIKSNKFRNVDIVFSSGQEYVTRLDSFNSPNKREFEIESLDDRFISLEQAGIKTYFGHLTIYDVIKLLSDDEGNLDDTNVFFDNIRYFQGYTDVNSKILKSLNNNGREFHTLHNGIIITSGKSHFNIANKNLILSGFSIVNGCQTCNMIWDWYKDRLKNPQIKIKAFEKELKTYFIPTKIVITPSSDLRQKITEAANTQNQIKSINLVAISECAKALEKKYSDLELENRGETLHFQRLPKITSHSSSVLLVNLEDVARAFYSVYNQTPNEIARSFGRYLETRLKSEDFLSDKQDNQYDINAYFITSLVANYLLRFLKSRFKRLACLKNHFLLLFFYLIDPEERHFNPRKIDTDFVNSVIKLVDDKDTFESKCMFLCTFAKDRLHFLIANNNGVLSVKPKSYYSEENKNLMIQEFIKYREENGTQL